MTNLAKQKILRMETYAKFPYLIEITRYLNDGTEEIYRYANSDEDIVFEENTYKAGWFQVNPPEKKQDGITDATLTISAIDPEENWIGKIRGTKNRARIRFVATIQYVENSIDYIESLDDTDFILTVANFTDIAISWTMKFDELMEVRVPSATCNQFICPALV